MSLAGGMRWRSFWRLKDTANSPVVVRRFIDRMPPPQTERQWIGRELQERAWCAPANSSGDTAASRARSRGAPRQVNLNHCRARHSYVRRRCLKLGPNCDPESIYARTQSADLNIKANKISGRGD